MFLSFFSFLSLVVFGCVARAAWPLCHENREICSSPTSTTSVASKKRQKKKKPLPLSCLSQNECRNVPATKKQEGTPFFLFFSTSQKKSLLVHFIIINNETLVWSEKDGGSAFAGGDDGQGDTHYALFSLFTLFTLSLRSGGVCRVSFVLLESQNLSF